MGDQLDQFHILPNVMLFCVRHTFKHLLLRPCIPPQVGRPPKGGINSNKGRTSSAYVYCEMAKYMRLFHKAGLANFHV